MKYRVLVALLSLFLCGIVLSAQQPGQGQETNLNVASSIPDQAPAQDKTADADQLEENVQIQRKLVAATIGLVIVGILQFLVLVVQAIVFFLTLRKIKDQATSMEKQTGVLRESVSVSRTSAEAAKLSAEAFIAENRPWLLVQMNINSDGIGEPSLNPVQSAATNKSPSYCAVSIKNYGKTPAQVIAERFELRIVDSSDNPPALIAYDSQGGSTIRYVFPQGHLMTKYADLVPDPFLSQSDYDACKNRTKCLWLCGVIKYQDTFENKKSAQYETRFCYLREVPPNRGPFWRSAGPQECNEAT